MMQYASLRRTRGLHASSPNDVTHWCATWLTHTWRDSLIRDVTQSYMTWPTHVTGLTHVWHDSFTLDRWVISNWVMSHDVTMSHEWVMSHDVTREWVLSHVTFTLDITQRCVADEGGHEKWCVHSTNLKSNADRDAPAAPLGASVCTCCSDCHVSYIFRSLVTWIQYFRMLQLLF